MLEAQSAQRLVFSGLVQGKMGKLLFRVQELEKGNTRMVQVTNVTHRERDTDVPDQLYRLQQDVNQLSVQQHQTTVFLGGKFTKTV